jgi:hypothetical protein
MSFLDRLLGRHTEAVEPRRVGVSDLIREDDVTREQMVRVYSNPPVMEYIPRVSVSAFLRLQRKKRAETPGPYAKDGKCHACGKKSSLRRCDHCGEYFCYTHLMPDAHRCY